MNTNFKPVLIYKDDERINAILDSQQKQVDKVNDVFLMLEKFFQSDLTDEDLKKVLTLKQSFVDELLKNKFQFPKASKEFNLEAMGKLQDYKHLIQELKKIRRFEFLEIKKGVAKLKKSFTKDIEDNNTHHTKNQTQNDMKIKFNTIIDNVNSLFEIGLLDRYDIGSIEKTFKFIKYKDKKFTLRSSYLLRIREDASVMAY